MFLCVCHVSVCLCTYFSIWMQKGSREGERESFPFITENKVKSVRSRNTCCLCCISPPPCSRLTRTYILCSSHDLTQTLFSGCIGRPGFPHFYDDDGKIFSHKPLCCWFTYIRNTFSLWIRTIPPQNENQLFVKRWQMRL